MKFKPALLHFKFDNFASLPSEPDEDEWSERQTDCNGHEWCLILEPGGSSENEEPGWISLYLQSENENKLDVVYTLSVKDANGATKEEIKFEETFAYDHNWGPSQLMERSVILDKTNKILKNRALHIDVEIQVKDDKKHLFRPLSGHSRRMLDLLKTGSKADTSFNIGSKLFRVHSAIIDAQAPLLGNHCGSVIDDITPRIFHILLEHIYSGREPTDLQMKNFGKELIDAANKYELVELKLLVENFMVRERIMTKKNVVDYILFADAQCCPLLKEYAISYFLMHRRELLKSNESKCLKESGELLSEIILLMNHGDEGDDSKCSMTVNELRKELGKRKLDVDGSRDALVSRLEEAKRQRTIA